MALEITGKAAVAAVKPTDKPPAISAADKRKLEASATVVEPKGEAKDEVEETVEETEDPLDEAPEKDAAVALTAEDVRAVLLEVREGLPNNPSVISEIVAKFGKKKLSELDPADFPAVVEHAKKLLAEGKAAAKKAKK